MNKFQSESEDSFKASSTSYKICHYNYQTVKKGSMIFIYLQFT
jgi:hypothetical protein